MLQLVTSIAALLCLAGGVFAILASRRERQALATRERLMTLTQPANTGEGKARTVPLPPIDKLLPIWLKRRLFQAGVDIDPAQFTLIAVGYVGICVLLFIPFGFLVAAISGMAIAGVAVGILDFAAARRMEAFSLAMSGFLDRVRQLVVVGNSLSVALARATQSSPPILVEFLSPPIRRIANGAGVAESINQLAEELDQHDLRLFGTAIETNLRFGGSLTAVLANLIENMRRRSAVDREIRSNTSQIRASAWILGLLPLVVSSIVMTTNPEYTRYFIDEPMGHTFLIYAALSEAIGAYLMRSIVRVTY